MGCAPSKGNTIAVQAAQTPRPMPDFRAAPPVTPPISKSKPNKENVNPLDVKRPLPAIGGIGGGEHQAKMKRPNLSTVPEAGEDSTPAWMKPDMSAMISDAKSGENNKEVKHTQSSVAFTFSFGDEAPARAPGKLPPLLREKTMKKETDEKDLKDSLIKRQQEVDNRRQSELDSIAKKKKRRKVKLKKSNSGVGNESSATENEGGRRESIVPPLDIPSSSDKNGSLPSAENHQNSQNATSEQQNTTTPQNGAISTPGNPENRQELDPRNGSAHHDSTYGSGDETGVDTQARVIDPLRRFSKRRKGKNSDSKKGVEADDEFYSGEEDVNPIEATNFFDD